MNRLNPFHANLTKQAVDALIAPLIGREEIRDIGSKQSVNGLSIRITGTGRRSWCVFRRIKGGQPVRLTIGTYPELSPTTARERAKELIAGLAVGRTPVKAPSIKAQAEAKQDRKKQTLAVLMTAYCNFLESRGRTSHSDARSIFRIHLLERSPSLASKAAADVTTDEVVDLLRAVKDSGKDRTANKLRSYLRAAFETSISAHASHQYPVAFKAFGITTNPVARTKADKDGNKTDKNALKLPDMRAYWHVLQGVQGRVGAMLRVHLLTGGQRIEQLVKLRRADVAEGAITIFDAKGRGQITRAHVVPLTSRARVDVDTLLTINGDFLFSKSGAKQYDSTSLTRLAKQHVGMSIADFTLKRVRSGVETLLAGRGVNKETRGRLQSHGVAGVQDKHYNEHDYMPEKLAALQLLDAAITGTDAKIIEIRAA